MSRSPASMYISGMPARARKTISPTSILLVGTRTRSRVEVLSIAAPCDRSPARLTDFVWPSGIFRFFAIASALLVVWKLESFAECWVAAEPLHPVHIHEKVEQARDVGFDRERRAFGRVRAHLD